MGSISTWWYDAPIGDTLIGAGMHSLVGHTIKMYILGANTSTYTIPPFYGTQKPNSGELRTITLGFGMKLVNTFAL